MIPDQLRRLARFHGLQLSYTAADGGGAARAGARSIIAVLRALGVPISGAEEAGALLDRARGEALSLRLEPVTVVWEGRGAARLHLPASALRGRVQIDLESEQGERRSWSLPAGRSGAAPSLPIPIDSLPHGYHALRVRAGGESLEGLVISAPVKSFGAHDRRRLWGAFLPLHALRTGRDWGMGDLSDLEAAVRWTGSHGGHAFGVLPLLASHPMDPAPSPYAPLTRLFWNELHLDPERLPGLSGSAEARRLIASPAFRREIAALRALPLAEPRRLLELKRKLLEILARRFFESGSPEAPDLARYMKEKPLAERYARFRANMEAREASWPRWPGRQRNGRIRRGDHDEELFRYHLYVQWRTHQQFEATGRSARDTGPGLYLDFPLGTHREGFDVWLAPHLFAPDAEAGAPPDSFFSLGQRWGTPPMRPAALREDRYRLFRHALRHHMRNAGYLRVDHVMGLHRLYWVPEGLEPHEGVYVRYPAEELLAVLSLESHINRTILIGEDLGTVPPVTRAAMKRHGMRRTWIFSAADEGAGELPTPPAGSFAALNTHDMPTFAALWKGRDLAERRDLGLLDAREAKRLGKARRATLRKLAARLHRKGWLTRPAEERAPVLEGCLRLLGASRAGLVMVNLEDLWGETEQQNTPGTVRERPNWRRRARLSLSEIDGLRTAARALAALAATRGGER